MINDYSTLPTYLIQKDSYTAYIARDDFCNTVYDPCSIELYIHDSIPRLVDDYTRSNLKRPTQRKVIIQSTVSNRDFSLFLSLSLFLLHVIVTGREKTKVRRLSTWKNSIRRNGGRAEEDGRRDDRSRRSNEGDVSGQLNWSQKNFAGSTSPPMIILLAPGGQ